MEIMHKLHQSTCIGTGGSTCIGTCGSTGTGVGGSIGTCTSSGRGIQEEELTWREFERIFGKNYLSKRYCDDSEKEFYELMMGSMTDEEYTSMFLKLLRYMPYRKEEKDKIQIFIGRLSITFKD